jgi:hypothetical protein
MTTDQRIENLEKGLASEGVPKEFREFRGPGVPGTRYLSFGCTPYLGERNTATLIALSFASLRLLPVESRFSGKPKKD